MGISIVSKRRKKALVYQRYRICFLRCHCLHWKNDRAIPILTVQQYFQQWLSVWDIPVTATSSKYCSLDTQASCTLTMLYGFLVHYILVQLETITSKSKESAIFSLLLSDKLNLQWRSLSLSLYFWLKNSLNKCLSIAALHMSCFCDWWVRSEFPRRFEKINPLEGEESCS